MKENVRFRDVFDKKFWFWLIVSGVCLIILGLLL